MTPEQIADVLDDAADYIEQHGWAQDPLGPNGEVCVVTALCAVRPAGQSAAPAWHAFRDVVDATDVISWNDAPGRTKQEVLDAFRAAAKQQRSLP